MSCKIMGLLCANSGLLYDNSGLLCANSRLLYANSGLPCNPSLLSSGSGLPGNHSSNSGRWSSSSLLLVCWLSSASGLPCSPLRLC